MFAGAFTESKPAAGHPRISLTYDLKSYTIPLLPHLPSEAEFAILTVLWQRGPSTVRDVHEILARNTGYTSTLKQMQVMHERGLLRRGEQFRSHVYEAAITRQETQARFAGDLMNRVFEGSARSLVLGALTAQRASAEDLKELSRIFDRLEKRKKSK